MAALICIARMLLYSLCRCWSFASLLDLPAKHMVTLYGKIGGYASLTKGERIDQYFPKGDTPGPRGRGRSRKGRGYGKG